MNKSILVLDENSIIHGLITSALETEGLTLHHEFNPGNYVERANSLMPDLILIGNSARDPDYTICRSLKGSRKLSEVPLVLLANSRDSLSRDQLTHLRVDGVIRKPFEASDLQQQVSKHLNLADMIGAAYEYRRSQSTQEDAPNPLANLDVLDEDVLGLLRGTSAPGVAVSAAAPEAAGANGHGAAKGSHIPGAPVVDDDVLAEALQPERAFEPIEVPSPPDPALPRHHELEPLESEFAEDEARSADALEELGAADVLDEEAEEPLGGRGRVDELGAADVLDDESVEESVLEPQGFDQELDTASAAETGLDDIDVELAEDGLDTPGLEHALGEGHGDLLESDIAIEDDAPGPRFEEAIPLSVRRMMELKPVLTMTQEASAAEDEVLEPYTFEGADGNDGRDVLDDLGEVSLDDEVSAAPAAQDDGSMADADLETPEPFDLGGGVEAPLVDDLAADEREAAEISDDEARDIQGSAAPTADSDVALAQPLDEDEDYFVEEYLGDEEIDEEQIVAAEDDLSDLPELTDEDEADLDEMLAEDEHLSELDEMQELEALEQTLEAEVVPPGAEIALDRDEEQRVRSSLDAEMDEEARTVEMEQESHEEPLFERNFNALEEERASGDDGDSWPLSQEDGGFALAEDEEKDRVIALGSPEEPLEEMPASALQDVDEEPASVEFGADAPGVFTREGDPAWRPKAPPSFVPQPAEEFPEQAVEEPFDGPHQDGTEPTDTPRHAPEEVLEDPDDGTPVTVEPQDAFPEVTPAQVEALAEEVSLEDVEGLVDTPPDEDTLESEPTLTVLTDDALGGVQGEDPLGLEEVHDEPLAGLEPSDDESESFELVGEADALDDLRDMEELEDIAGADDALRLEEAGEMEPAPDEDSLAPSASVTRGEMDALLAEDDTLAADDSAASDESPDALAALDDSAELEDAGGFGESAGSDALEEESGLDNLLASEALHEEITAHVGDEGNVPDSEFDSIFASLRDEIAANPEGERLEDVLRVERIRDGIAALELSLPQREGSFARAMGIYALPGVGAEAGEPATPAAVASAAAASSTGARTTVVPPAPQAAPPPPAPRAAPPRPAPAPAPDEEVAREAVTAANMAAAESTEGVTELSLLDPDIRAKLGLVLDEIISMSVRKAVQEEMPKIMERLSKGP